MPSQSSRWRCRSVIGSIITVFTRMKAAMPIGRFTKNTQCHDSWSVMKPPMSGPITDENPNTADMTADSLARCSSV